MEMIFRQAWRVFRLEGRRNLFAKAKKKAALYRLQKTPHRTTFSSTVGTMDNPNDTVKNWLQDNRNNFGNPFYNLLNFLVAIHDSLDDIELVSCNLYQAYLHKMIHGVFVGLIGYLTLRKTDISLLDFGTGASYGIYGHYVIFQKM